MNSFTELAKRTAATAWTVRLLLSLCLLLSFRATRTCAQTIQVPEYQLKAAFIYNFAKFITWPSNSFARADAPIVLAVLGDDPFGATLPQTLAGKSVNGRPIEIIHFQRPEMVTNCHILFVARSETDRLVPALKTVAGRSVLTIGDFDRFAHRGGMINLFLESKAIRFEINANATERGGFKVSPKLGGLGKIVRGDVVEPGGTP